MHNPLELFFLTLPCLKARGFLVLRHTLKLSILAAVFKPGIRSKEPNIELNLDSLARVCLPKLSRIASLVSVCPTVHFRQYILEIKSLVSDFGLH